MPYAFSLSNRQMRTTGNRDLVSVVVPVRDGERFLGAALESVLAQAYEPLEVIVIDDGSTDGSLAVARSCHPSVRAVAQPGAGLAAALNHGVRLANGGLLAFLDADDLWPPGKLGRQTSLLDQRPDVDAVFGHAVQFEGDVPANMAIGAQPACSKGTMLIRREAFDRVGPFSSEWRLGDFVDWWARAVEAGVTSVMLREVVLLRRVHDANMGVQRRGEQAEYARVLKAMLDRRRQA
jgi:glycosyltransferase involved in cell wall biosynthesis